MALGFTNRRSSRSEHSHGHNLTSLVDCFAIILIYLLMATSFGEVDLEIPKDMKMPKADKTAILEKTTIIQVRDGGYFIAGQKIEMSNLAETLKSIFEQKKNDENDKLKNSIVIQADKNISYGEINPVVLTGLQAGFDEVQFAVLKNDEETL